MDVSSLTGTTASQITGQHSGHRKADGPEKTMQAVAAKLGMDPEALRKALKSGSTMSSLAAQQGISQDDLVATIAATLPTQGPDGVATDPTGMATQIANGSRPAPPARPEVDVAQGLDALSSALGISSDDLMERLTDGTGISDLLSQNPSVANQLTAIQNRGALVDGYA